MRFLTPFTPKRAIREFISFAKRREREHVIGAILSVLVTSVIVVIFLVDSQVNTAPPPQVIYAEVYAGEPTDEEIVERQEREQREIEERARERQRQFQELDDALERAGL
ncbi:hypothetical protein [Sphingomicrobium sediminis]|uniref:Uncharacterized protein n=1 Tax=Sphingomicrobium sediminis TaxID=2950949 RepID=A0A9X2EHH2_9SPHN|nr:hypothetical protein [Sphingomicrobium sediminis]MCM8558123.1 hypothetical protein [Sphingomicrobium sediminis]